LNETGVNLPQINKSKRFIDECGSRLKFNGFFEIIFAIGGSIGAKSISGGKRTVAKSY
jgi:hypothetical protein